MRILLIHQVFVAPSEPGGTRHYEFARHSVSTGHSVTIVASDLSYLTGQKATGTRGFVTEQMLDGVRVLRAFTFPSLHRSFTWRIVSFLSFMISSVWAGIRAGPVDLVMGTSPPIFQGISAWLVARLRRTPFLLEVRDLWPDFAIDMGVLRNPALIVMSRWLEGFLYRQASHILVNSPAYRDYLVAKGLPQYKISLISNGVDPDMFNPDAGGERVKKEFGLSAKFVVTYAGALGLANDIPTILRASKRLKDNESIHFLVVGDGKERPVLEAMAREWQLNNVTFAGARAKSDMLEILAASDLCVATLQNIPMFRMTYPNKVFDYMAAGRPIVLAIDGVIREVVERAKAGVFVPPGNDEQLATAIVNLRSMQSELSKMGMRGREFVSKHFNRRQQAADFVDLAHQLCRR